MKLLRTLRNDLGSISCIRSTMPSSIASTFFSVCEMSWQAFTFEKVHGADRKKP